MIDEIRKAPEDLLSFGDALDEVSIFAPQVLGSINGYLSRHFKSNTLSERSSPRIHITSPLSKENSPGLFHNSRQKFMKKLSMLSTNMYL